MLKRTNIYLDSEAIKALEKIGKKMGGLKAAQMVRLAVSDYLARHSKKAGA